MAYVGPSSSSPRQICRIIVQHVKPSSVIYGSTLVLNDSHNCHTGPIFMPQFAYLSYMSQNYPTRRTLVLYVSSVLALDLSSLSYMLKTYPTCRTLVLHFANLSNMLNTRPIDLYMSHDRLSCRTLVLNVICTCHTCLTLVLQIVHSSYRSHTSSTCPTLVRFSPYSPYMSQNNATCRSLTLNAAHSDMSHIGLM